jgi:hypothetical protein
MVRPKTDSEYLASLRQFEPDLGFSLSDTQERRINDVLATFIAPYVHSAQFLGSKTSQQRFLKTARHAIARYIGQRDIEPQFDRGRAKKLLSATSDAIEAARVKLDEIACWRELSNYLRHLDAMSRDRKKLESEGVVFSLPEMLEQESRIEQIYSAHSLDQVKLHLLRLEAVIAVAAERVEFRWGDAQRDQIAQLLTDELAYAWMSATGKPPTCSRPNLRLKHPSPFALLLVTVNAEILDDHHRSPNNFLEYGIKSVRRIKERLLPAPFSDDPSPKQGGNGR